MVRSEKIDGKRSVHKYEDLQVITHRNVSGLSLLEGRYPGSTIVPSHAHEHAIFCIVLNGLFEEMYGRQTSRCDSLMAEFLPRNDDHSLFFTQDTRVFNLKVPTEWLELACDYSLKLDRRVVANDSLRVLLLRLYKEFSMSDAASALAIEGLTLEMLTEVSRSSTLEPHQTPPPWISDVMDLLHERFRDGLSLAEIAEAVGVHPVHLAREFRRFKRSTVGGYIRHLRIEQASRDLTTTDQSLALIAAAAGFFDQSHFCRVFKRKTGMTPVEYRRTFRTPRVRRETAKRRRANRISTKYDD